MSRLIVAPIVEGHGDVSAVPVLLRRVWSEVIGGAFIDVLRPIRDKKDRLVANKQGALERAVQLAAAKLTTFEASDRKLILILIDANGEPPCILGPGLLQIAQRARSDHDVACVIAKVEYETWFVAAAESLSAYLDLARAGAPSTDPEGARSGKGWIEARFRGTKYSETVDQPRLTAKMDLQLCRRRSPSFDKLCRDLETRAAPAASAT